MWKLPGVIDWSPWTLTAHRYAKCYVWAGDAGNGRGSHMRTDTANTGGFGTLNIPREAMGYAVQHGGDMGSATIERIVKGRYERRDMQYRKTSQNRVWDPGVT